MFLYKVALGRNIFGIVCIYLIQTSVCLVVVSFSIVAIFQRLKEVAIKNTVNRLVILTADFSI